MKILIFLEKQFWGVLIVGIILALLFPFLGEILSPFVLAILMVVLYLAYLKIDLSEFLVHIKKPFFLLYILSLFLFIIPVLVYFLFQFVNPHLAIACLLLAAIPTGIAAPALTDIVKGNTSLAAAVCFVSYLVAPFSVVFLFQVLTGTTLTLDSVGLFKTLLLMSVVPLIAAQITRKYAMSLIEKTKKGYSGISILFMGIIIYIVIAVQTKTILADPLAVIPDTLWLYSLFFILQIVGYFSAFWRKKEDKIALSVSKAYMNNALAIVLALQFFGPQVALLTVLSEIPWGTTLGIFKYMLRFAK
jgi:bile acid:Na+ symporter, BASS family